MDDLLAVLTRPVSFSVKNGDNLLFDVRTFPAGTEVSATIMGRRGRIAEVRIPGSFFVQAVSLDSIDVL
jgi:hypothetical protein